jgi:hypothetical protein
MMLRARPDGDVDLAGSVPPISTRIALTVEEAAAGQCVLCFARKAGG